MDEAGRGPLAGPVAVGVTFFDSNFYRKIRQKDKWWQWIDDSKKLSSAKREELFSYIEKNIPFAVGLVSAKFIDRQGIRMAIEVAAKKALKKLKIESAIILADGNKEFIKSRKSCRERTVVNGDARLFSIACASIIAKVTRDRLMKKAHRRWPKYCFDRHKGYGTALHLACLKKHGPCPLHRFSFAPLKNLEFRKSSFRKKRESVDNLLRHGIQRD